MSLVDTPSSAPAAFAGLPPTVPATAPAGPLALLSTQQRRVIELVCQGLLNKQIAHELGISPSTVKAHVSAAYRALGVQSRVGAVLALTAAGHRPAA